MPERIELAAGPSGESEMNVDENPDNLFTLFLNFLKSDEVREDSKNGREYKKLFTLLTESEATEENFVRMSEILDNLLGGLSDTSEHSSIQPNQFSNEPEQNVDNISENEQYNRSDGNMQNASTQPNQFLDESEHNDDNISADEQYNRSDGNMQDASTQPNQFLDESERNNFIISANEEFNISDDEVVITNRHIHFRAKTMEAKQAQADPRALTRLERIRKLMVLLHRSEVIEAQFTRLFTIMSRMKEQCKVCNPPNQPQQNGDNISQNEEIQRWIDRSNDNVLESANQQNQFLVEPDQNVDITEEEIVNRSDNNVPIFNSNGDNINRNEEIQRSNDNMLNSSTQQNQFVEESDQSDDITEEEIINRSDDDAPIFNSDMSVPIGTGNTWVRGDKFAKINWKTYTAATRSLMRAVFDKSVLATHSLTGKPSPIYQNRPRKKKLNVKKVQDVVNEIMNRYEVSEPLIRSIISSQCTEQCRVWRTRCMKNITKKKKTTKRVRNV